VSFNPDHSDDGVFDLFANNARRYGADDAIVRLTRMGVDSVRLAGLRSDYERRVHEAEVGYPPAIIALPHEPWYPGPLDDDRYWPRLRSHLADGLDWPAERIRLLNEASTKVVAYTPNPKKSSWVCKGLVIGYVQSGKTTNFTAVIAKAADAGYNLVVVLSGIHNGLRRQTQERLDAQLKELAPDHWVTMTSEDSDFKRPTTTLGSLLANDRAVLCVVKKNAGVLRKLRRWLEDTQRSGGLRGVKALIIDDEADQASVETRTINPLLKAILAIFPSCTYVGYTATPFANVLVDPSGDDLYPEDFILNIPRPDGYFGTEMIFGRDEVEAAGEAGAPIDGYDMVRLIPDLEAEQFRYRRNVAYEPGLSPALRHALMWFWLATSARRARGDDGHSTMLIHTSMQTAAHQGLKEPIDAFLAETAALLDNREPALLAEFEALWEDESSRVAASEFGLAVLSATEVMAQLSRVVWATTVVLDNSRSLERLSYGDEPVTAIAIGGNTLSRGLTLEGLVVSFFVRGAQAYDTLLQMGRWFGFRQGYQDLPRIWMTAELRDWFRHLASVEHEIRLDVNRYEHTVQTPREFGVRIRTHPTLLVTRKMGNAIVAFTSYGGRRVQTRFFKHGDLEWLSTNREAGNVLLASVSHVEPEHVATEGVALYRGVDVSSVLRFLNEYRSHEDSPDLEARLLVNYIESEVEDRALLKWNVAVMAAQGDSNGAVTLGGRRYGRIVRARLDDGRADRADIKTLMSKEHRVVDLPIAPAEARKMAEAELVRLREEDEIGRDRGLLLLYPIDPGSMPSSATERSRTGLGAVGDVIGMAIVFPGNADNAVSSSYIQVDLSCVAVEDEVDDLSESIEIDTEEVIRDQSSPIDEPL